MVSYVRGLPEIEPSENTQQVDEEESFDVAISTIDIDGNIEKTLEPVHISKYSGDSFGQSERLTDAAGNSESRTVGATGMQVTIEGILTIDQLRKARSMQLHDGQRIRITIQPWEGEFIADDFTFDKPSDLNKWYSPNYEDGAEAFTFQLKTKDPTSEG